MAINGPAWDSAFEAAPRDADLASGGAGEIRKLKAAVAARLFRDHVAGEDPTNDNAGHSHVSFVGAYGAGEQPPGDEPAVDADVGYLFVREGSLIWRDATNMEVNLSAAVTTAAASVPVGAVLDFGGAAAPTGYLLCNGAAVQRSTYADLFTAIGTRFGAGDGSTTFNVPDFRRRVAVGSGGTASSTLGAVTGNSGGAETHTLTIGEMPAHTHNLNAEGLASSAGTEITARGQSGNPVPDYATKSTGGGGAHNNLQPSLVVTKIIKA